jgi:hypothetical protein
LRQFMELPHRSIRFPHLETVPILIVIGNSVLLLHACQGKDVGTSILVIPHLPIPGQVTHQACRCHSCIAMDVHMIVRLLNVLKQSWVTKHVNC